MDIQELKTILSNYLAELEKQKQHYTFIGDVAKVLQIDIAIQETNITLSSID